MPVELDAAIPGCPHFTWGEFVREEDLRLLGPSQRLGITCLCWFLLEPLRHRLNTPIRVTSGFRSINRNREVGGASSSQHTAGEAADIVADGIHPDAVADALREIGPPFKMGVYPTHVHISVPSAHGWAHPSPAEWRGE